MSDVVTSYIDRPLLILFGFGFLLLGLMLQYVKHSFGEKEIHSFGISLIIG
ncbi:hypothetical protein [Cytobacillus gottheilii]|uniref:hypothetical protein n=1 Tax=Cytobacillus gottheilii TaxID=859144 RepID=UPI001593DC15|nr:hypothetical protein [Cytobacillus gottheilii]